MSTCDGMIIHVEHCSCCISVVLCVRGSSTKFLYVQHFLRQLYCEGIRRFASWMDIRLATCSPLSAQLQLWGALSCYVPSCFQLQSMS